MGDNKNILRVAIFTDTFFETNGVAHTYRKFLNWAIENQKPIDFYTYDTSLKNIFESINYGAVNLFKFKPRYSINYYEYLRFELFQNPSIQLFKNYQSIHIATPGSMGITGRFLAKKHNIKMYGVYHTKFEDYVALKFPKILQSSIKNAITFFYKQFYKDFSLVLAPTPQMSDWVENNVCKSAIMSRGIDCVKFLPDKSHTQKNIIYIGRIAEEKNLDLIKKAYKESDKSMNVIFTGDGPYRKKLQNKFPEAIFNGYKYKEQLIKEYQKGDLFVFPSLSDTYGNVIQEAMACEVPCLVLDKKGPGEIINNGIDGWIAKDEQEFIYLFNYLINQPELLEKTGKEARKKMLKKSWDCVFEELWEKYEV